MSNYKESSVPGEVTWGFCKKSGTGGFWGWDGHECSTYRGAAPTLPPKRESGDATSLLSVLVALGFSGHDILLEIAHFSAVGIQRNACLSAI